MSSFQRASSGVRDLRAVFEQKLEASPSSSDRGSSPFSTSFSSNGNSEKSGDNLGRSKFSISFSTFEPSGQMAQPSTDGVVTDSVASDQACGPASKHRRESFSLNDEQDAAAIEDLKKTVSETLESRKNSIPALPEVVPEQAMSSNPPTPVPEAPESMDGGLEPPVLWLLDNSTSTPQTETGQTEPVTRAAAVVEQSSKEAESKHVNGEAGASGKGALTTMQPSAEHKYSPTSSKKTPSKVNGIPHTSSSAEKVNSAAVRRSLPHAKPSPRPSTTSLQKTSSPPGASKATNTSKPPKTTTARLTKEAQDDVVKRLTIASQPKAPAIPTASTTDTPPSKTRPSRTSLPRRTPNGTPPANHKRTTAVSVGQSSNDIRKVVETSSHHTAPTASSTAKHDPQSSLTASKVTASRIAPKQSAPQRKPSGVPSKPATSERIPSTSSGIRHNAKPESRPVATAKSSAPPNNGFLDRMTRPTAASANRVQETRAEKEASKSPPRRARTGSARVGGKPPKKRPSKDGKMSRPSTSGEGSGADAGLVERTAAPTTPEANRTQEQPRKPASKILESGGVANGSADGDSAMINGGGRRKSILEATPSKLAAVEIH